jgi:hypothetical protein
VSWTAAPSRLLEAARLTAHGGGRRCQEEGCAKGALAGGTLHCFAHGGGRRCHHEGCSKWAQGGGTPYCVAHGGGKRCQEEGCAKGAVDGRDAPLQRAWRGQTLPARGLYQVCSRRHAPLVMNLQFSILMAQTTDPSSWH